MEALSPTRSSMTPPSESNKATQSSYAHCSSFPHHVEINDMMSNHINSNKGHD